ncbi:GntR family transcriptional regulator [Leifsonia bigeumensis]|uniref:GntR family transcriptional regulator n=1 Tax=Leifsonella bigeumensis TaxID=433643 RepID=A0ABP7FJL2_9MICO
MRASDQAFEALRGEILEWTLRPGTILTEVEQADRLKLSRTPIREAFARLTAEGLLVPLPGRGVVVSDLSRETIIELFELRVVLESEAARLVALRRDPAVFLALRDEFLVAPALLEHDDDRREYYALVERLDAAMDAALQSRFLLAAIRQLRPHLTRARRLARDDSARLIAAAGEHMTIVEAIVDGDSELAANATSIHLKKSLKNILNAVDTTTETVTTSR